MNIKTKRFPSDIIIALVYAIIGTLWILFSDKLLLFYVKDIEQFNTISMYKGWFYVAVTGILLYILIHKELTKRNTILTELEKSKEKAEESDKLKTAFLSNMSHYLRTPMNSILGFIELLKGRNINDEKREKFLAIINEQSNHLLQFIDNIIEISKLQEGQTSIEVTQFSVNDLLGKLLTRFKTEIEYEKKNSIISINCYIPDNSIYLKSDSTKLEYILTNLISNSIKFTPKGEVNFGVEARKDDLTFYVKDTGIGISQERTKIITNSFLISDPNIRHENTGSGIGLALTNGFVKLLGGKLWIEKTGSEGTDFRFTLPQLPN